MLQRIKQYILNIRLKRLLLAGSLTLIAALLALATLIAALPAILSTTAAQSYMRSSLTKTLKRQVTWSALNLSWSKGVDLRGLVLGDGPAPLLKFSMEKLTMAPEISYGQGRWRVDLALLCRSIAVDAAPGPPKPPKPYKEPLTAIAEAVQRFQKMDWPLPIDLGVKVAIEPASLSYKDPGSGRSLELDNLAFRFDMPSLADRPIAMDLRSGLTVDGHPLKSLVLSAGLQQLVTPSRRIRPAGALVDVKGSLPGSSLTLKGGLQEPQGFAASARLQLPEVMAAFGPLLPKKAPAAQGLVELQLLARFDDAQNLHASMDLSGSRVALSGGPLKGRVGPLNLRVRQAVVSDHGKRQVSFSQGGMKIDNLLEAGWEATVDRPGGKDRDLNARFGPASLDLEQALATAGPLLGPKFPVRELAGELTLQQLSLKLKGGETRGEVILDRLLVSVPRLRLALARGGVTADGAHLSVDKAIVPLEGKQPSMFDAALSYGLQRCRVSGPKPVVAEGLKGSLQLAVTGLNLRSRSPRKFVANAEVTQSLDVAAVRLERKLSADTLHQQLTAQISAKESGEIEVTLPELKITAAGLQTSAGGKQLKSLPLSAVVTASGIRMAADKGGVPVVEAAGCKVAGGDFLQLSATAALPDGAPRLAASDGTVRLDMEKALPFIAPFLPKGAAAKGISSLTWSLAAPVDQQPLPRGKNPLIKARAALAMARRAEIAVSLDNRAISWPLKNGRVNIAGLRTTSPLQVTLPDKGGKITLAGAVDFAGLGGLSGAAGKLPLQSGSFSVQGELGDWQTLKLHQELRAQPYNLVQKSDVSVSRIGRLLEKQEAITAGSLLQQLDSVLTADLEASFPAQLTPFPGGIELSGESRAELKVNLAAGRELRLRAAAAARGFGARLANGTTVEGVHADLLIDRTYALSRGDAAPWSPLSVSLVRPSPEPVSPAGAKEIAGRVREDLRGEESGSRKFTIRRLVVKRGDAPLELTSLEGDLLLGPEEAGLSFFQSELLGGTVRLRSMIDLKPEVPVVAAACSFTNLETVLLLPPEIRNKYGKAEQETGITGEVSLDVPLQTGQRELLEGLRMRLNLRKIGADTLERALFGLDPDERNEQVVKLRKQLRHGSLQVLRAATLDGAFGLNGEVNVKGVTIALPQVERVRLSELPIRKQMAKALAGIASLRKILDLARADTLVVGPEGKISLVRGGYE